MTTPEGAMPPPASAARKGSRTRLTRRGRIVVWAIALIGAQVLALGVLRMASSSSAALGQLSAGPAPPPPPSPLGLASPEPWAAPMPEVMARMGPLTILVPTLEPAGVAYHEASYTEAKGLRPVGRCVRNANRTKFDLPAATPGLDYMVMSSRGRPHPATSAVDVAMRPGTSVLAPVSGTVIGVKRYYLYGRFLDYRIAIRPAVAHHLRVVLIHVDRVRVRQGSKVTAGATVLAVPRVFPFHSQVNNYVKSSVPHVHLEVKAVGH